MKSLLMSTIGFSSSRFCRARGRAKAQCRRAGIELCDHGADPQEMKNLAAESASAETVAEMKMLLATPQS